MPTVETEPITMRRAVQDAGALSERRIDVSFDLRSDAQGKDPDTSSPTLRRYHQLLWSKPLPDGRQFDLSTDGSASYLHHSSDVGDFVLSSDSAVPSFRDWKRMKPIVEQMPSQELEDFQSLTYTIGGMMVFPAHKIDGQHTINAARGLTHAIADRLDLTLECIRRHYEGESSPLAAAIARYSDFFGLFRDFQGYVDFFLLADLVAEDGSVRFFLDGFSDFLTPPRPSTIDEYRVYRDRAMQFITARNGRIEAWAGASTRGSGSAT